MRSMNHFLSSISCCVWEDSRSRPSGGSTPSFHDYRCLACGDSGEVYFLSMLANCGHNVERQGERSSSVFERNDRCGALPNGPEERFQLRMEWFLGRNRGFSHPDLWIYGWRSGCIRTYREYQNLLPSIIEGYILPGLKEAD